VDRLGDYLLSQSADELADRQRTELGRLGHHLGTNGTAHKKLQIRVRQTSVPDASPQLLAGTKPADAFVVQENGVRFELSFREGYSVGLFLDQRDNRRRLLTGNVAAGFPLFEPSPAPEESAATTSDRPEVLNAFAYTCGFSVCAALGGARTTSLDLSRKYLEWGKRNFLLNQLDPAAHDFIYGDCFDWAKRLARKGRRFDLVILDPPTFSQSKESGVFRVDKHFGKLVRAVLPLLKAHGVLFCSTNAADWPPEDFLRCVHSAIDEAGGAVNASHYVPQPPDFPISREEPAYLKTVWLRVG
jgi:23S rRNA (cytosine1962-C5)-methyltransferase